MNSFKYKILKVQVIFLSVFLFVLYSTSHATKAYPILFHQKKKKKKKEKTARYHKKGNII